MSEPFRTLEHPSDIGIEIQGATAAELFENAARALMSVIGVMPEGRAMVERTVSLSASDLPQLLVRWLSEVLFLYDGEKFLTAHATVQLTGQTRLHAVLRGESLDPSRHTATLDVKAVTYHQLTFEQHSDGCVATVFFDI